MAFGQQSGPPATAKQLQQLTELILAAGHSGFPDARGPLGLNQRQAAGRFTRDEADAFIEQLEAEAETGDAVDGPGGDAPPPTPEPARRRPAAPPTPATAARAKGLRTIPSEVLAAELQRRGWVVMEP